MIVPVTIPGAITGRRLLVAVTGLLASSCLAATPSFAAYDFRDKGQNGFRLKGGFTYQTSVAGRSENNFRIPGGHRIDAGLDYTLARWNVALNVNNVTDEVLPIYAISQSSNTVTPPRTVLLSLRRSW